MTAPLSRELSDAEREGWRKFWDGWVICPACAVKVLEGSAKNEWPVPANYCRPIEPTARCSRCSTTPETPLSTPLPSGSIER